VKANAIMKILLRKNVSKLGIIGDVVEVKNGYARNYLFPSGLATHPTETNIRALAEARKHAEHERAEMEAVLRSAAERLSGVEVTIQARANEEGVLYGSVGAREIAAALVAEGHEVEADHIKLKEPIRHLDHVTVPVKLLDDLTVDVVVWVVRERKEGETEEEHGSENGEPRREADEPGEDRPE
jgi:large subunit ribosomal protein L9